MTDIVCPKCGSDDGFWIMTRSLLYHEILEIEDDRIRYERRGGTDCPDDSTAKIHCDECQHEFIPEGVKLESW